MAFWSIWKIQKQYILISPLRLFSLKNDALRCPWILCFDLLPLQYTENTELTHHICRFLVYREGKFTTRMVFIQEKFVTFNLIKHHFFTFSLLYLLLLKENSININIFELLTTTRMNLCFKTERIQLWLVRRARLATPFIFGLRFRNKKKCFKFFLMRPTDGKKQCISKL